MSKGSPAAPDYTGAAQAQGQQSQELATQQNYANRPTVNTPWGQQSWATSEGVDPSTGQKITNWTQNITLTPDQQKALDEQQKIQSGRSEAAGTLLDQATQNFQTPANWDGLAQGGQSINGSSMSFGAAPNGQQMQTSLNGDSSDYRQRAQSAVEQLQAPGLARQREGMDARLAAQGITAGSDAYKAESQNQSDAEARAQLMAIEAGRNESSQMFSQDLQAGQFGNTAKSAQYAQDLTGAQYQNSTRQQDLQEQMAMGGYNSTLRQQQIAEMAQKRGMSLNELNALLTGQQVSMPNMPGSNLAGKGQTTDLSGAMEEQYGAALGASNAKNQQTSSTWGAVGTAAVMALSYY